MDIRHENNGVTSPTFPSELSPDVEAETGTDGLLAKATSTLEIQTSVNTESCHTPLARNDVSLYCDPGGARHFSIETHYMFWLIFFSPNAF